MIDQEHIAHDLAMVYISNRFGVDVSGDISSYGEGDGMGIHGSIFTEHLPNMDSIIYEHIKTDEKGFLGIKKRKKIPAGLEVDSIFIDMISEYTKAFKHFKMLLKKAEKDDYGDVDIRSLGVAWFCDKCNASLDTQNGFDWHLEEWKCQKCGFVNSLSEENIE